MTKQAEPAGHSAHTTEEAISLWASVLMQLTHPLAYFGLALLVLLWFCRQAMEKCSGNGETMIVFWVGAVVFGVVVLGVLVLVWFKPMHLMLERQRVIHSSILELEAVNRRIHEAAKIVKDILKQGQSVSTSPKIANDKLIWVLKLLQGKE